MSVSYESEAIRSLATKDIQNLVIECNKVLEERKNQRHDELIKAICDAMNELYKEFPNTELNVERRCPDCGEKEDFDVMYHLCSGRTMKPRDFSVW